MSHSIILYENIWLIKMNYDFYFIEVCFYGSDKELVIIGLSNGLAPNRS